MMNLWGIDLGGTKVEGIILKSAEDPQVLFRERIPTEADRGYERIVTQIGALVDRMAGMAGYRPAHIGIGAPGTLDPKTGVMKNCNTVVLNNKPLKKDVEDLLGVGVYIANDANCFALAETKLGIVKNRFSRAKVVFGIIMGTGVGGGLVVNGEVINGLHGIAGEWGHNFLDASGGDCYCGKAGCVEKILSGPALEGFYTDKSGVKRSLREITELAAARKDEAAVQTITRLTEFFGLGVSVLINILDPDVIVVGGGVGNIDVIYTDGIEALHRNIFNYRVETPIVKPMLGDSAGVYGAAFLCHQHAEAVNTRIVL